MKWYVAMVETGRELDARQVLQAAGIPARVPREAVPTRKGGTWTEQEKTLFPGYVFFGCEAFDAEMFYTLKRTPGYLKLLGPPPPHPQAISYLEAEYIGLLAPTDAPLAPSVVEGGVVVAGVLTQIPGEVLKLDIRRRRARVAMRLLGEEKVVEFSLRVADAAADGEAAEDEADGEA